MAKDGTIDLEQPLIDDPAWNQLVDILWRYQWVSSPIAITTEIKELLHDLTQGITFCTVTLLKFSNVQAIEDDEDSITEDIIRQAYKEEFKLFMPALDVLRDKNYAAYDDLMPLAMRRLLKQKKKRGLPESPSDNVENDYEENLDSEEIQEDSIEVSAVGNKVAENDTSTTIDKIQRKKRLKESAQDVYDRLKSSGFFIKNLDEINLD